MKPFTATRVSIAGLTGVMNDALSDIQIFRAGSHTDSSGRAFTFTRADIEAIVGGYDAAKFEAPVVIGHPAANAPAYGWVTALRANGEMIVSADARQVHPDFSEAVKAGRYKKVSASFYTPDHPANPAPGNYYLRHVGFLGAAAPAVKGLKPVELDEDDSRVVTVEFAQAAQDPSGAAAFIENLARQVAARLFKAGQRDSAPPSIDYEEEPQSMGQNGKRGDEDLLAENVRLKKQAAEFAAREEKARRAEDKALIDGLVEEGRLAPGLAPDCLSFMAAIDDEKAVNFADSEATDARGFFRDLLGKTGKVIDLAEHSRDRQEEDEKNGDAPSLADAMKKLHGLD